MVEFGFELNGITPLLMHGDNIDASDELERWRKAPENKGKSKAGDDRSPSWTWQTYLYFDADGRVVMPADNIMAALRKAGSKITLKKQTTFKSLSQSGLLIVDEFCGFSFSGGKTLDRSSLPDRSKDFGEQSDMAQKLGLSLFKKRANIGQAKHIRVRPRFDDWRVTGRIMVMADEITKDVLQQLLELAGREGLCDWRPGCKTPGPFGQFTAKVSK